MTTCGSVQWANAVLKEMWPFYDYAVCEMLRVRSAEIPLPARIDARSFNPHGELVLFALAFVPSVVLPAAPKGTFEPICAPLRFSGRCRWDR